MRMNMNTLHRPGVRLSTAVLGTVLLASCTTSNGAEAPSTPTLVEAPGAAGTTAATAGSVVVRGQFRIDTHGSDVMKGGSNSVFVYSDPSKEGMGSASAHFKNGDPLGAVCETTGRTVSTIPSEGEAPVTSNKWVEVVMPQRDDVAFATEAYGEIVQGAPLPPCGR